MLKILRNEQGSVVVLAALAVVVMMGFGAIAVDVGNLYLNKTRVANVADAAALAGVQDLPGDTAQAVATARSYAAQNGNGNDIVQPVVVADNNGNNTKLKVTVIRNVPYYFARVFGITPANQNVSATSTAKISPITATAGIVPWGIVKQSFVFGQTYQLKEGAGSGYNGNYGALALGGNGANTYRDNIKYGYSGQINVGDWLTTEPGNMSGPTSQGVDYRISQDPGATFQTVQKDSARIVIVPVIDDLSGNGLSQVQVVGFAAFFLEGVGGQGNNNYVYGEFMQMVTPGQIYKNESYGSITADVAQGYGLYGSALITN